MPLPARMQPAKVSSKKIKQLAALADRILGKIDNGVQENDPALQTMIADWNSQVPASREFTDFRDFSSWTSATEFTRMAFNQPLYYDDFRWPELLQIIEFISQAEGSESELNFALALLEANFSGNPSDLIFWPDAWFGDPEMLQVELSIHQIAGYLMARSQRPLADAPPVDLPYPLPQGGAE